MMLSQQQMTAETTISEEDYFRKIQLYLQKSLIGSDGLKVTLQPEGLASLSCQFSPASTNRADLSQMFKQLQSVRHLKIEGAGLRILPSLRQRHTSEMPVINLAMFPFLESIHLVKAHSYKLFGFSSLRHSLKRVVIRDSFVNLDQFFVSCLNDEVADAAPWKSLTFFSFRGGNLSTTGSCLPLLTNLKVFDLSYNCLTAIEDFFHSITLVDLNLGFNQLANLSDINLRIGAVSTLILSKNKISELGTLSKLYSLKTLDLSFNLISSFSEVQGLKRLPELSSLSLVGNPLTFTENYRITCLTIFAGQIQAGPFSLDEMLTTRNAI